LILGVMTPGCGNRKSGCVLDFSCVLDVSCVLDFSCENPIHNCIENTQLQYTTKIVCFCLFGLCELFFLSKILPCSGPIQWARGSGKPSAAALPWTLAARGKGPPLAARPKICGNAKVTERRAAPRRHAPGTSIANFPNIFVPTSFFFFDGHLHFIPFADFALVACYGRFRGFSS